MYKIDEIKMLRLGQRDENLAREIRMDASDWLTLYPDASIHILFRRPGESAIVPMITTLDGTTLIWQINDYEVGITGVGNAEIRAVDTAGLRRKSRIIPCSIEDTLLGDDETVLYTQDQVDQTLAHIAEAAESAAAAQASEEAAALSAQEAGESAASAGTAADAATSARDAAQAAQTAAETAQHQAEAAQSGVHADAEAAEQAKVAAQAAQAGAQGAASQASADRTAAESARADAEAAAEHAEAVVEGIDQAGADQVEAVNAAGQAQVTAVNTAGATQVGNVNAAGTTQVNAVQAKGTQVINSIPADYSALSSDVTDLKSAIDGEMNGTNGITDYVAPRPFTIDSSKVWKTSTSEHISIPVNAGDTVSITANSDFDAVYAALKSDNAELDVAVDFCDNTGSETWQERKVITKNNTAQFTAPSDCNFLYIAIHPNNASRILTPKTIIINGVNISYNIRKKIDEIADDIDEIADDIEAIDGDVSGIKSTLENIESEQEIIENALPQKANKKNLDIWGMRSEYGRMFSPVDFSSVSFLAGFDFPVFFDGYKIVHSVDLSKYKNVSANTFTVSTQAELETAVSEAVSGDTIIIIDGVYTPITLTKSINLIGNGKPIFVTDDVGTFDTTGSDVVFRTVNSFSDAITAVYDASRIDEGIIIPMAKKNSVSGVVNNPGSWIISSSSDNQIYVHLFDGRIATNRNVIICDKTKIPIKCIQPTENATIYMENITVVGGNSNLLYNDYGSYNTQKLIAKGCRFYFGRTYNNVSLYGVDGFFQNCEASFSHKDGFNYHKNVNSEYPGGSGPNTGTIANGFEIDCIGHDNGFDDTAASPSDNGSTIHNGGTAVRINGVYYHNKGGNVADTSANTVSYNYCCYAFDNMAPQDTNNADFWANNSATMYLYGCRADGDSQYNLWVQNGATLYADKTEYTTHLGDIS